MIMLSGAIEEGDGVIMLSNAFPKHASASLHLQKSGECFDLIIDFKDSQEIETECFCIEGVSSATAAHLLTNRSATVFANTGESLCATLSSVELNILYPG